MSILCHVILLKNDGIAFLNVKVKAGSCGPNFEAKQFFKSDRFFLQENCFWSIFLSDMGPIGLPRPCPYIGKTSIKIFYNLELF